MRSRERSSRENRRFSQRHSRSSREGGRFPRIVPVTDAVICLREKAAAGAERRIARRSEPLPTRSAMARPQGSSCRVRQERLPEQAVPEFVDPPRQNALAESNVHRALQLRFGGSGVGLRR